MNKKANVNKLTGFALVLVVFTVVLAIGLTVLSQLQSNLTAGSVEANATSDMITHLATIPGWIPVIIVAMVGGIVLFLVIKQFSSG